MMKKTIVALLALSCVASAATTGTKTPTALGSDTYKAGTVYGELVLSNDITTGYINGLPGISVGSVTLGINGNGTQVWTGDYTVSIWLGDNSTDEVLFGYSHAWSSGTKSNAIVWDATNKCITMGTGEWAAASGTFTKAGTSGTYDSSTDLSSYLTSGLTNITLAVSSSSGSMSADLWVNGVYVDTLEYDSKVSGTLTSGNFTSYSGYKSQGAVLGSISLTNEKLTTAASVAQLAGATLVPEPATATLSLLALAGLAARRRRK